QGAPLGELMPELQLRDFLPMAKGHQPYLIVNATVETQPPAPDWQAKLFEFSPLHRGNADYGYIPWPESTSFPVRRAVAISGAAVSAALKQTFRTGFAPPLPETLTAADGGHSENLGAIALVRRRVRNIIVVDAGQDTPYSFESYTQLRNQLH